MPDPTKPADGQAGDDADTSVVTIKSGPPPKTFTQEELDAIIETRLRRAIPADYESLKAMKVEKDAKDEENKTELQKAKDASALAEATAQKRIASADARLLRAAILEAATKAGAVDAEIVVALLVSSGDVTIEADGTVKGATTAVKALLKDKPFLATAGTPAAAGDGGFRGIDPKDKPARIIQLEEKARDPKISTRERQAFREEARILKIERG